MSLLNSLNLLLPIFVISTLTVWFAGVHLSKTVDIIDHRFGLGEAFGGMIFLAIVTNLPEVAIVISASFSNNIEMAVGNILGGIAIQTIILALLDCVVLKDKASLSYKGASLQVVLEAVLLISILDFAILGAQLPASLIYFHIAPGDVLIVITWLIGLWLINQSRLNLPWHKKGQAPDTAVPVRKNKSQEQNWQTTSVVILFLFLAFLTLLAGVALEESSRLLAKKMGMSGGIFGATVLALITALPEISTGYEAIKMGKYNLAFSDIFGGNAFLPVLFMVATLITGQSVLPHVKKSDLFLTAVGIILTAVYIFGLIFRPKRQIFWFGIDSVIVIILYAMGTIALFWIK